MTANIFSIFAVKFLALMIYTLFFGSAFSIFTTVIANTPVINNVLAISTARLFADMVYALFITFTCSIFTAFVVDTFMT